VAVEIDRTADVDDDGTMTTGTVRNNAWKTALYEEIDAALAYLSAVQTITLTGAQNDVALTNGVAVLRCNNASDLTITGIEAGVDGQLLEVRAIGAGNIFLAHQSGNSAEANRLINAATTGTTPLAAGVGVALYRYDATTERWRLAQHEQNAFVNVAFDAGNFLAVGGGNSWTVAEADQVTYAYKLNGRIMRLAFAINATDVGGTPTQLTIAVPGGFTCSIQLVQPLRTFDAGTDGFGICYATVSGTVIVIQKISGAFTATTSDNTTIQGTIDVPVN
jgi:hypothetical protein